MKKKFGWILVFFLFSLNVKSLEAYMFHKKNVQEVWKEENIAAFDELMISWNASRPIDGRYSFYVSVKINEWSPWLLYAVWGHDGQSGFLSRAKDAPVKVYQDAVEALEDKKATGFQIKIMSDGDANLNNIYSLHVYTNSDRVQEEQKISYSRPVCLKVPGLSQMSLNHIRHADLCSPTSTTAVCRFLSNNDAIDPIHFANNVWDKGFDIFGNWVFNVAESSSILGRTWSSWVERLSSFDDIYQRLNLGTPVIVSVRGPLQGSASHYAKGHLMAVIGYNPIQKKVICMDPAFSSDEQTHVFYDLSDFVQAWNRRGNVAYIFDKN